MNYINEYNLEPGVYKHYKGGLYVVTDLVTHMDNPATAKMEALPDPLVVYRDVTPVKRHVKGKPQQAHQVYARPLSEFTSMVTHNELPTKRFTKQ
jgi:hypothetical protein